MADIIELNWSAVTRAARSLHQMDARFSQVLNRWACLVFSIAHCAADLRDDPPTAEEMQAIYERGAREDAIKEENSFVKSTTHVGNIALDELGLWPKYRCYELYRERKGQERQTINAVKEGPTHRIDEYDVANAGGHFVKSLLDGTVVYDPSPDLPLRELKSSRYLAIVEQ